MSTKQQVRRHYQRQNRQDCQNKIAFTTERAAAEYKNRPLKHSKRRKEKLHVYRCLHCGNWHLGHEFRKKQFR